MKALACWILLASIAFPPALRAEIKLLAVAKIPGADIDKSNLTDKLEEGTPHNRLGGFGSAIAHLEGNRYVLLPDRGPKDGASRFQCRFQIADLTLQGETLKFELKETVILRDASGQPFLGDQHNLARRLDSEGVAISKQGTVYVSDEYGPKILEFNRKGKLLRDFPIPEHFLIANPSGHPSKEAKAGKGRSPNRGFEGLTRTPGGKLVAMLQSPLLQDDPFDGVNTRILELDPQTLRTREFVYQRDGGKHGMNEILAISDTEFLVLERDTASGKNRFCKIFRISTAAASDVSKVAQLPATGLPKGIVAVSKTPFLDLTKFGLSLPEKVEGLCIGPNLADGRRLLLVTTDNDFTEQPSQIYAFAVDEADLR